MADELTIPKTAIKIGGGSAPVKPAWFEDDGGVVWVICACGDLLAVNTHHGFAQIAQDGTVTPDLAHTADARGCAFQVRAKLEGWEVR